ncbi:glycosyltransferase domain-containing protein [Fibrobacter sp. UBA2449]|uniref:glycosyltransferase domain-containing protein n=1 Tax=Fibrobacter sp. UBA2449 TaxID=1946529 RepID=UPI0025C5BA1B|nr:glycosyltransferase domain-containing protein [Fibrobacter sp. UBA2449]
MNRHVIYTAVVGNYDKILQPLVVDNSFDYILFSNDIKEDKVGVWQIRKIDYYNEDQIKIARWVKTHPERLLPGYDFSVWMDANIQIATNYIYHRTKDLFLNKALVSSIIHPIRTCIYKEMFVVFLCRNENIKTLLKWSKILQKDNYPYNNSLHETNIIFRNHTSSAAKELDYLWWNYIEKFSRRDQLSFNYVLWKLHISCTPLLPQNQSARNSIHFNYNSHANNLPRSSSINITFSWMQYYCSIFPEKREKIEKIFFKIIKKRHSNLWMSIYEKKYRIATYAIRLYRAIKTRH